MNSNTSRPHRFQIPNVRSQRYARTALPPPFRRADDGLGEASTQYPFLKAVLPTLEFAVPISYQSEAFSTLNLHHALNFFNFSYPPSIPSATASWMLSLSFLEVSRSDGKSILTARFTGKAIQQPTSAGSSCNGTDAEM